MSFLLRSATLDDAAAVARLVNSCEAAYEAEPAEFSEQEVRNWLERLAASILVTEDDGHVIGFGGAQRRGDVLASECLVSPDATGRGIGACLLDWAEEQAATDGAEALRASVLAGDPAAKRLLSSRGFVHVRSFFRMVADFAGPPPQPKWPTGVSVALLREDEERVMHQVIEESFADHWEHVPRTFEEWRRGLPLEHDLTFIARAGGEPAGAVVCHHEHFVTGMVGILGVRPAWRRRGLGRALLLQGFGALYERGRRRIALDVDGGSETGALELYESAGMRSAGQQDLYEKRM